MAQGLLGLGQGLSARLELSVRNTEAPIASGLVLDSQGLKKLNGEGPKAAVPRGRAAGAGKERVPFYALMGEVQTPCWGGQTRDLAHAHTAEAWWPHGAHPGPREAGEPFECPPNS